MLFDVSSRFDPGIDAYVLEVNRNSAKYREEGGLKPKKHSERKYWEPKMPVRARDKESIR